jgi:hypothetical protein
MALDEAASTLLHDLEAFADHYPQYETRASSAMVDIERRAFNCIPDGTRALEETRSRLSELDLLISRCLGASPLAPALQERFTQAIVSLRPRLSSVIAELAALIEDPPKASLYPNYAGANEGSDGSDTEP